MSLRRHAAIAACLGPIAACDAGQGPSRLAECPSLVTVTAGTGTTPSLSWTPTCRASEIIVDPNSDFVDYWVVRTAADTNGLIPPARYGTTPSGASTLVPAVTLQAGSQYRVRVLRATGDTTAPFEVIGATFFTP